MSIARHTTPTRRERLVSAAIVVGTVALFSVLLAHAPAEGLPQSVAENYLAQYDVVIPADPTLAEVQAAFATIKPGISVIANTESQLGEYVAP